MDEKMEDVCEKVCVFEKSSEIDFDYEFDAAMYFDFTQPETPEEIAESERWFLSASGYPPSPLVVKLDLGDDELADSVTSSPRYGHHNPYSINNDNEESEVSSPDQSKKGHQMLTSKSKSTFRPNFPMSSRLLQPTASHLAKQNQQGVCSMRVLRRLQKLGTPLKPSGDVDATKRQKLEIGYLRKVAHLKHQTSFSHKSSKKVGTTDVNSSHERSKVTVPKEPDLATAHRAQRHRSKNAAQLDSDSKCNSSFTAQPSNRKIQETRSLIQPKKKNTPSLPQFQEANVCSAKAATRSGMLDYKRANSDNALLQEKSDQLYKFKARPFNKKIFSSKGEIGIFRNCKKETTVPREFKLSNSKKLSHNPPIELFSKLSLHSENHPSLLLEEEQPLKIKGLKKNASCSNMKENKNVNIVLGKSMRCCVSGGRMNTDVGNHLTTTRSFAIH